MSVVSRTSFQLKLPLTWHIHNVFHRTLLTPYKETALNSNHYQEPAPDLGDGQPKWEVEQILGVRKRCQQLQYLVRWKGFSEAHNSWEPLTNISADKLIKKFYNENPAAIFITYKTSHQTFSSPITIHSINIMSHHSLSPSQSLTSSPVLAVLVYPDSPPTLPIPPPLSAQISDPPIPLTLMQHQECWEIPRTVEMQLGQFQVFYQVEMGKALS
jgi:hypothetical protein